MLQRERQVSMRAVQSKQTINAVLITGASRGLGRALAIQLAEAGKQVGMLARDPATLQQAVIEARARAQRSGRGGDAHAIAGDVADVAQAARFAGLAQGLLGPIDALVHNASYLGETPLKPVLGAQHSAARQVFETNVLGPLALTQALVGNFVLRGSGLVLGVSSDAATAPYPTWGTYGASKAAFDQLLAVLAAELASSGVHVLCVDPGEMDTQMHADAVPDADPSTLSPPDRVAACVARLIQQPDLFPSGTRVSAAQLEALGLEAA